MPSKQAHVTAAKSNQAAIDYLLKEDTHLAWVVTIAFYKALHTVEALLASGSESVKHFDEHKTRNKFLKSDHRYSQIWKMYRPLFEASLVLKQVYPAREVRGFSCAGAGLSCDGFFRSGGLV